MRRPAGPDRQARRQRRARRPAAALMAAATITSALALSACGQTSGTEFAQEACVHVHRSIEEFVQSVAPNVSAATAASLRQRADSELRAALPLAAQANSADGSWNSLMTTLSESATIDEGHLMPALRATCAGANSDQNVNPQSPQTPNTPNTQNVNPRSPGS